MLDIDINILLILVKAYLVELYEKITSIKTNVHCYIFAQKEQLYVILEKYVSNM
jgi:hypothetical protein